MNDVVYKFNTLKRAAKGVVARRQKSMWKQNKFLDLLPGAGSRRDPRKLLNDWYETAYKIVDECNIGMVRYLMDAFPSIVPKSCLNREIEWDMDDCGDWIVVFKARPEDPLRRRPVGEEERGEGGCE